MKPAVPPAVLSAARSAVPSIRGRLLGWLLLAVAAGALLSAAVTYRSVSRELEEQFDYALRQMALSLRDQGFVSAADAAALADEQMDFVVQIWSVDGVRIYASHTPRGFPPQAVLGFSQIAAGGATWRVFCVTAGDHVIQVAQPVEVRHQLAAQAAWRSALPVLGVGPLLAAVLWWTVGASLLPLRRVVADVRMRDAAALEPLAEADAPAEVAPLVRSINALLERLRASLSAQRAFVADAAHELRSPLTALKLQLDLLNRADTDAGRAAARAALSEGIERATRLVEQLLTLARNEPGAPDLEKTTVDLAETARLATADTVALAHRRQIEIALDAPDPLAVRGNATALRILVRNLIDNAVRYTPPGGCVQVAVRAADGDKAGGFSGGIELLVDDSGPGIPAAERERVFDRFYRRAPDAQSAEGGSGLGLAIVRAIAQEHAARLALDDSPLGGLRVRVLLECAAPTAAVQLQGSAGGRGGPAKSAI